MTLHYKRECPWHNGLSQFYVKYPKLCPYCTGTMQVDNPVYLPYYDGEFVSPDIEGETPEVYVQDHSEIDYTIICICGDEVSFTDNEAIACKCGRIYRLSVHIEVDRNHIGEQDWIIEESKHEHERFYKWKGSTDGL